ncbi:MAG: LacI family DNA-binding transcriptional regulator [Myxococcota bacterium]
MPSRITMADLARLAGVAPSTVSRALNGSPLVNHATRKRIVRLAEKHGYVVNATASSLRRRESGALGLVIPLAPSGPQSVSDPFFLEMIGAVTHAATTHGYDLLVSLPSERGRVSRRRLLSTGRAEGLIVVGQAGRHDRLNELARQGAPIMVWGGRLSNQDYVTVGSDNVLGGRLATTHLLMHGRERLLFLGDPDLPEVGLRYQGFIEAHAQAGLEVRPDQVRPVAFAGEAAAREVSEVVAAEIAFDGIVAASDMLAVSAIHALQSASRRVPEDVAIVGYDNLSLASQISVPLTTVCQDIANGGVRLVQGLLEHIAGQTPKSEWTATQLVVRKSCGQGGEMLSHRT